jgi:hypothetical protein
MAHRNRGASDNDLVTDANLARFQHAGGPMTCPVADAALLLDAMMSLIFRNETKRLAEAQAATGQVRLRRAVTASNLKTDPVDPNRKARGALRAFRAERRNACT